MLSQQEENESVMCCLTFPICFLFRVSDKLNKHPNVRKSLFEILGQVKETKFYQTFQAVNNRIRSVVSKTQK